MSARIRRGFCRAIIIVLAECLAALLFGGLVALSKYLGGAVHSIALWLLMPLFGAFAAGVSTFRGLNNYLSWLFPPAMLPLAYYIVYHFAITPGPVFLCALVSIIGAATGDELRKRRKK